MSDRQNNAPPSSRIGCSYFFGIFLNFFEILKLFKKFIKKENHKLNLVHMNNLFESAPKSTASSRRRAQTKPNPATYVTPRQSDVNDFFRKRPPKVPVYIFAKTYLFDLSENIWSRIAFCLLRLGDLLPSPTRYTVN